MIARSGLRWALRSAAALAAVWCLCSHAPSGARPATAPIEAVSDKSTVDGPSHEGEILSCYLPESDQIHNIGSFVDGAGMCVMSSIEMAARLNGMDEFRGLRDWCARIEGGGASPTKVDRQLRAYCRMKSIGVPDFVQYEGANPEAILDACDKSGRMACITYGYSPRYGRTIQHMVCAPRFGVQAAVLDNNFPGENSYEWMSREELLQRMKHPKGSAWVFVWLTAGPPPAPKN